MKNGEKIKIAGLEWTVLERLESGYLCITEDFERLSAKFDKSTNNWESSDLRKYLNTEFKKKIEGAIENELVEFKRDLLSLDGQTEYGNCMDKVSLLTVDEYRKYRNLLPNTYEWWWLCTPWSTPCNGYEKLVTVVSPSGSICNYSCFDGYGGVRPVCIFSSLIFESGVVKEFE